MFNGRIIDDFLSKEDCEYFLNYALEADAWSESEDTFWNRRAFYPELLTGNSEFKSRMSLALKKLKKTLIDEYNLPEVYADTFHIVRWYEGQFQPPHQDNMENVNYGVDFFRHRAYGAIIYLNDDFDGGETYYPLDGISIKPKVGRLAIHLGDKDHLHGVSEVSGGTRYTIASFWGVEKEYDNEY